MGYNHKVILLFGLVLVGLINKGYAKPTNQDDADYPHDDVYDDEEEEIPPENKSTENSPTSDVVTQRPFFPSPHEKYHIKLGSNAELKCAAKYLSNNNVVLWYKESNVITNGNTIMAGHDGHYELKNDHTLIISNTTETDGGNYYCEIQPQNIKLHVEVQIDEEESSPEEQQQPPAEHNQQASQVGEVNATESNSEGNGSNEQISQSIFLTLLTIGLTTVLRI